MIKEKVSIEECVNFLNDLLCINPIAINTLMGIRIACNLDLANHETVQVNINNNFGQVGMIGVLNGLFGKDKHGWGHISANYDNGEILSFSLLTEEEIGKLL